MKNNVLLEWDGNWADEMDVSGFAVMEKKDWNKYKKFLSNHDKEFTFYIGTNEEIEYENGKELLSEISVTPITDEQCKVIEDLFGGCYGFTHFLEVDNDEDDDDDY